MNLIAKRMSKIRPSSTLAVEQKARTLKAEGKDVISLSAGEPDFDTPNNIKQAAIEAIKQGKTKYTAVGGTEQLKQAIIYKYRRDDNLHFSSEEVMASTGGKQILFNAFMASLDEGDEVILPTPFWVSYPEMINFAGATTKTVHCGAETEFKLVPQQLAAAITPKTKWLILNSPNNPTGVTYSAQELKALTEVLLQHPHVYIMTDDIYEHLVYDGAKTQNILAVEPRLKERTLLVNGVSKTYAMTGWRIGYAAGPAELIKAMTKLQSQSTSNPCSIAQAAAAEALSGVQDFIIENNKTFKHRRDIALKLLAAAPGISCVKPQGAFYLFPDIAGLIGKTTPSGMIINNDGDFANYLLEEHFVAVVPGSAFGNENHIRISYATSEQLLTTALQRLQTACKQLV